MDMNNQEDTQIHRILPCKKKKAKQRNNISRDVSFSRWINSNRIFTDTNPGIKKNHKPTKIVTSQKTKGDIKIKHLLSEDDLKRQKCVLKKYK